MNILPRDSCCYAIRECVFISSAREYVYLEVHWRTSARYSATRDIHRSITEVRVTVVINGGNLFSLSHSCGESYEARWEVIQSRACIIICQILHIYTDLLTVVGRDVPSMTTRNSARCQETVDSYRSKSGSHRVSRHDCDSPLKIALPPYWETFEVRSAILPGRWASARVKEEIKWSLRAIRISQDVSRTLIGTFTWITKRKIEDQLVIPHESLSQNPELINPRSCSWLVLMTVSRGVRRAVR